MAFVAFISGIWHGAGLTFLLWGLAHGLALVAHRIWAQAKLKLPKPLAIASCFLFVSITWVLFRAESVSDALFIYKAMFMLTTDYSFANSIIATSYWWAILGLSALVFFMQNVHELDIPSKPSKIFEHAFIFFITVITLGQANEFLYFQF